MEKNDRVYAFNEWMRRYTEEPAAFEAQFQSVVRFLRERDAGQEPTYGVAADAYMEQLVAERAAVPQGA